MQKKGISPIISSVLLIAVTLTVVGLFSGWAPEMTKQVFQNTGNTTTHRLNCDQSAVSLISAHYNGSHTEVAVRNTGTTNLGQVMITAFDSDNTIMSRDDVNITSGNLTSTSFATSAAPSYIKAFSQECGSVTDRLDTVSQ